MADPNNNHEFFVPFRHDDTFIGMFWLLLGNIEDEKIMVEDPAFELVPLFGRIFMIAHVVCTVIVALNMLIAMINNSFQNIMVNFLCSSRLYYETCGHLFDKFVSIQE